MSLKRNIIDCLKLNAGEYVSGEALAQAAGKSRAAVWKAVNSLKKEGYVIEAVTNKGYRLVSDNDILNESRIRRAMRHGIKIFCLSETDSTNNEAKRLISAGERSVFLVTAEKQTAGRGRQGKSFYSPALTGAYMTLAVHPNALLQNAVTATTAAAVAVCKAVERLTDKKPLIKWVNDVYCGKNKICGILTEAITDFESGVASSVIVGIGINIKTKDFPEEAGNAGSLDSPVERAELIGAVADELLDLLDGGSAEFIDYYRSRSMILGKRIRFTENGRVAEATAVAIDDRGGLVIKDGDGNEKTLRSGEITVRWQE